MCTKKTIATHEEKNNIAHVKRKGTSHKEENNTM